MTAIRAATRRLANETLVFQMDITANLLPNLQVQPVVDSTLAPGADPGYSILRIMRAELPTGLAVAGYNVLVLANSREIRDKYQRWTPITGLPRQFADDMNGNIMLDPIPTVALNGVMIHMAVAPHGETYEKWDSLPCDCEEAIVCGAASEILVMAGRERDMAAAKEYRRRFLIEIANIRSAVELGTSGRYILKNEPNRRAWPGAFGPYPSY